MDNHEDKNNFNPFNFPNEMMEHFLRQAKYNLTELNKGPIPVIPYKIPQNPADVNPANFDSGPIKQEAPEVKIEPMEQKIQSNSIN